MKKLIVIHSNIAWTISNFRLELIKHLINSNFDVLCISDNDNFNNTSVVDITSTGARFINIKIKRKGLNPIVDIRYFLELFKILKKERPDFIFNYTIKPVIYGSIAARLLKIRTISVITGLGYIFNRKGLLFNFVKFLYKLSLRSNEVVVFLNKDDKEEFIKEKITVENKTIILPGEGINSEFFVPMKNENNKNKIVFLMICRLLWEKGLKEYFNAAEKLISECYNVEFQLLGFIDENNPSGISKKEIDMLEKKGIIKYLGVTSDVRKYISNADCIVLPSFYREGLPRTLLEAASMAKPIITTNSIGCKEVVEDKVTGYLCNPKDADDLILKTKLFLNLTDEQRILMGNKGRELILQKFDQKIINSIYDSILNKI